MRAEKIFQFIAIAIVMKMQISILGILVVVMAFLKTEARAPSDPVMDAEIMVMDIKWVEFSLSTFDFYSVFVSFQSAN